MSAERHGWYDELQDLMRGVAGAAIIGVPLIYTMEMWQLGTLLAPRAVLILLGLALIANVGYNVASGFRNDSGLASAVTDSIEALGIGLLLSGLLLALLRIIDTSTPWIDIVSKTAVEAVPLSIGVSVANTQFATSGDSKRESSSVWADLGIALAGGIVFSFSVAPTEEIMRIASRITAVHLLALIAFSVLLAYGMIFVAEWSGLERRRRSPGLLQTPLGETLTAYALALGIGIVLLHLFHDIRLTESPFTTVAATVVLALPATIGGAAGRLLV